MKLNYKSKTFVFVLVGCFAILLWLVYHFISKESLSRKQPTQAVNVKVFAVVTQNVGNTLNAIGSLSAKKSIIISPEIAGQVENILFAYGQTVRKGQPLYQLDDQLFQAQYLAAQSDLHLSELTYHRNLKLVQKNAISRQDLDKAQSDYQDKKSEFRVLQVKLNKMLIHAPFSGVIGASQVDAGQYVSIGQPLVRLVDKANLIVKFSVPEQYLDQVRVNQKVSVRSSAFAHRSFTGFVTYVSPSVNPTSRTVMVWANIANPQLLLAPGLFVHVILTVGIDKNIILIPQEALIPSVEGNDVYVVHDGKAYKHAVKIAKTIGDKVQVIKGLQLGDKIVTLGQEKLANGRKVRVVSS